MLPGFFRAGETNMFPTDVLQLAEARTLASELMPHPLPAPMQVPAAAIEPFRQGLIKLHSGQARDAVGLFSQAVQVAPTFAPAQVCLGVALAVTYDIYPALDHLQLAVQLEPESFTAHYLLAQLYFKLRIPQKGYAHARAALDCPQTLENRKMLVQLLREERARECQGIARPWFYKNFRASAFCIAASGLAAMVMTALMRTHQLGRLLHGIVLHAR
jgi:tetratricopeptide (TPR) repeat protein